MQNVNLEMWVDTWTAFLNKLLPMSKVTPNNKTLNKESPVTNDRKTDAVCMKQHLHNLSLLRRHNYHPVLFHTKNTV
jgi:hypothetical protein